MSKVIEIRQHNALTNARYEYTELQMDLLFFLISKLRKDSKEIVYALDINDLTEMTGKKYSFTYLKKSTEDMGKRMFEVETPERYKQLWLFRTVEYIKGTRIIEIKLSEDILPLLFDVLNNFTSYELAAALRLTSKYAKRIYQLCSQWKDQGVTKRYEIVELRRMLGLLDDKGTDKMSRFSDFKESVLDIAVKQICEHTELHIDYKLQKQGKTIKYITFSIFPQALAETVPFDLVPSTTVAPAGVLPHQVDNAARLLTELGIKTTSLLNQILSNPAHIMACNQFAHDLKTGKVKSTSSRSGLLLTILGLKSSKKTPLFEA